MDPIQCAQGLFPGDVLLGVAQRCNTVTSVAGMYSAILVRPDIAIVYLQCTGVSPQNVKWL